MMMPLLSALLNATPVPVAPPPAPPLPGWLAGCWMAERDDTRTEECWTVPRGEMMLASSHTFVAGDTRSFEHKRIVREGATLVFIAQPGGAPPTRFPMVGTGLSSPADGIMFQNLANDYPQRIRYAQAADGTMIAEISQADGSRPMRWVFRRPGQ